MFDDENRSDWFVCNHSRRDEHLLATTDVVVRFRERTYALVTVAKVFAQTLSKLISQMREWNGS